MVNKRINKRNYKQLFIFFLTCFVIFSATSTTYASDGTEKYWDKGRWYGKYICKDSSCSTTDNGNSTVVLSVGAFYQPGTSESVQTGRERVRVWSKTPTVQKLWGDAFYVIPYKTEVTFSRIDQENPTSLIFGNTDPADSYQKKIVFSGIPYTLLNYKIPGMDVIGELITNTGIFEAESGVKIERGVSGKDPETGKNVTNTVATFYEPTKSDLPSTIPYYSAEKSMGTSYSGNTVKFEYTLPSNIKQYNVRALARVQYAVLRGAVTVYNWTTQPYITHTVNS